jgi:hypothetical protein
MSNQDTNYEIGASSVTLKAEHQIKLESGTSTGITPTGIGKIYALFVPIVS